MGPLDAANRLDADARLSGVWSVARSMFPDANRDLDPAFHRHVFLTVVSRGDLVTAQFAAALYEAMPQQVILNKGAAEFVHAASQRGLKLAVVSNTALDIRPVLRRWGLACLFDAVTLSFEVGCVKPDPRIFRLTADALQVGPRRCIMIGDTPTEDGGATAAGMQCLISEPSAMWRTFEHVISQLSLEPPRRKAARSGCGHDAGGVGVRMGEVKRYILFDHDGVLVDTEYWYFAAGQRALREVGVVVDEAQYLVDMSLGRGIWVQARAAGVDGPTIDRLREVRDAYYQEYLRTEPIEIDGVVDALAELSQYARLAIVTTSKRADFELIHRGRDIRRYMDFVLVREDYTHAKPDPEPYLAALSRFGAAKEDALVVEDSNRGLRSAVAAGIDCAVVRNEFTRSHDFSLARYRVETLAELKDIVIAAD